MQKQYRQLECQDNGTTPIDEYCKLEVFMHLNDNSTYDICYINIYGVLCLHTNNLKDFYCWMHMAGYIIGLNFLAGGIDTLNVKSNRE